MKEVTIARKPEADICGLGPSQRGPPRHPPPRVQVASRSSKQSSKEKGDYRDLFVRVAQFLVACVPLLLPPDAPLERVLEQEDAADGACRLCDALVDLVLAGHLPSLSRDLQLQVGALPATAMHAAHGRLSPASPVAVLTGC